MAQLHRLKNEETDHEIDTLMKELRLRRRCLDSLHDDIIIQIHSVTELESMRKHYMQECSRIETSIQKVEEKRRMPADTEKILGWIERYRPYFAFEEMTRPMLAYLVEKIVVGQDKKVEVKFVHEREYGLLKKVIE